MKLKKSLTINYQSMLIIQAFFLRPALKLVDETKCGKYHDTRMVVPSPPLPGNKAPMQKSIGWSKHLAPMGFVTTIIPGAEIAADLWVDPTLINKSGAKCGISAPGKSCTIWSEGSD